MFVVVCGYARESGQNPNQQMQISAMCHGKDSAATGFHRLLAWKQCFKAVVKEVCCTEG